MIEVTADISINESEIEEKFIHASGPGGQNINKVASAVQLRFSIIRCDSIPEAVKKRLVRQAGKHVSKDGILIITARRYRTQEANRRDAMERLITLIKRAAVTPKKRIKTAPSKASKLQRLAEKRYRGEKKKGRQTVKYLDDN